MSQTHLPTQTFAYDDKIVKRFLLATIGWGFVALLLGVLIASQLANWKLNFGIPWLTFGRLRPLHTNAAIFAFAGNAIFAGIYHSSQRLLKTRMASDTMSNLHFWGWQLVILLAAITLPLGFTQAKEYAELEWPIDLLITGVWVTFAVNFFMTIARRRERHIYVAIWFYIATIVTVALLHVVNAIAIPVGLMHSYPVYAGVQDALVQWWYGHNAVAFFLTTPFLGLMYYYVPKAINRPIYSYRLSIIHFWSLVFIYIWAGPHHLLYSALPEWAQVMGVVFSVTLIAPSWGGMINGLLTMRGAWDRVRKDPILKFLVAAITFYGMSTFEGPLLSIKSVNALAHYTDWIIGHVHGGVLGWNGFMIVAMCYYLVPRLWKTKLYSEPLATVHFWLATLGIVMYLLSMWTSGITQGLMLRAMDGTRLMYPDFMETVVRIAPLYYVRAIGGAMYLAGYVLFIYNMVKTIKSAPTAQTDTTVSAPKMGPISHDFQSEHPHRFLEGSANLFIAYTIVAVLIGSIIEIVPTLDAHRYIQAPASKQPYTPLELLGRDIYIREGCYNCHSQMIRPLHAEVIRYGAPSTPVDSIYDHPFQWGSRRTGPDLANLGGKYPDSWHFYHMKDPRKVTPKSIMPAYPWLFKNTLDTATLSKRVHVMQQLGVPYTHSEVVQAVELADQQAKQIADNLRSQQVQSVSDRKEIIALIAYLQRLHSGAQEAPHK